MMSLPNFSVREWMSIKNKITKETFHTSTLFELATCDANILVLMVIVECTF